MTPQRKTAPVKKQSDRHAKMVARINDNVSRIKQNSSILDFSSVDNVEFFTPKEEENLISIIPYIVAGNNHPQGIKAGDEDYLLEYYVHKNIGPGNDSVLCNAKTFSKPCPICEEMEKMKKDGGYSQDDIKPLYPSRRVVYNIIDQDNPKKGLQIFTVSHYLFEKELLEKARYDGNRSGAIVCFADPEDGIQIKFRGCKEKFGGNNYLKYKDFEFVEGDPINESIIKTATPLDQLLNTPSYEQVSDLFYGADTETTPTEYSDDDVPFDILGEEKAPVPKPKRKERSTEECPSGLKYGIDTDGYDVCEDCAKWDNCIEEYNAAKKRN